MKATLEAVFVIHAESGTKYRVRDNPDAAPGEDAGIVLDWSDDGEEWHNHFFIEPEAIRPLVDAMMQLKVQAEGRG